MTKAMAKITPQDTNIHFVGSGALSYEWWSVVADTGDALGADPADDWSVTLQESQEDPEEEPPPAFQLDHKALSKAVNTLARLAKDKRPEFMSEETVRQCREFIKDPDDADFDADTADQVIQYALLGKIVYG
jgi:hypothetical protein